MEGNDYLKHFDKIFNTQTLKNIKLDNMVLLKELYSWVYTKDLVGYGSNSNNTNNTATNSNKKSNEEIANDIINKPNFDGWGTGETRKQKLKAAGYDPDAIQRIINQKLK